MNNVMMSAIKTELEESAPSSCVFCYKNVETTCVDEINETRPKREEIVERFFSVLEKLAMQIPSVWSSGSGVPPGFHKIVNLCCEDCGKIMDSFCGLYHQIKCLELHLNWKLETLKSVMTLADNNLPSGVKSFRGKVLTKELVTARRNLMEQWSKYLTRSSPRVIIEEPLRKKSKRQHQPPESMRSIVEDEGHIQSCFIGWIVSFVTVVLLSLLDASNVVTTSSSVALASESSPIPVLRDTIEVTTDDPNNAPHGVVVPQTESLITESTSTPIGTLLQEDHYKIREVTSTRQPVEDNPKSGDCSMKNICTPERVQVEDKEVEHDYDMEWSGDLESTTSSTSACTNLNRKLKTAGVPQNTCSVPQGVDPSSKLDTLVVDETFGVPSLTDLGEEMNMTSNDFVAPASPHTSFHEECEPCINSDKSGLPPGNIKSVRILTTIKKEGCPEAEESFSLESGLAPAISLHGKRKISSALVQTFKFQCPLCPMKFPTNYKLQYHRIAHLTKRDRLNKVISPDGMTLQDLVYKKNAKFHCSVNKCRKKFHTKEDFDNHSQLHGTFLCSTCRHVEDFAPNLALHETKHHKTRSTKTEPDDVVSNHFYCVRCAPVSFSKSRWKYVDHFLESHLGVSSDKIKCPTCQAEFEDTPHHADNLVKAIYCHYIMRHDERFPPIGNDTSVCPKVKKCHQCPASFFTSFQLSKHRRQVHKATKKGKFCRKAQGQSVSSRNRKRVLTFKKAASLSPSPTLPTTSTDKANTVDSASRLEEIVEESNQLTIIPMRQLRKIHKCFICEMTFSKLNRLNHHQETFHKDNDDYGTSDENCDSDSSCDTSQIKGEEVVTLDQEWRDEFECNATTSSSDMHSEPDDTCMEVIPSNPDPKPKIINVIQSDQLEQDVNPKNEEERSSSVLNLPTKPRLNIKYKNKNNTHPANKKLMNMKLTPDGMTIRELLYKKHAKYQCSRKKCRKKFHTSQELDNHSKLHGNFQCSICSQVETFAPALALHEATHSDETPGFKNSKVKGFACVRCVSKPRRRCKYTDHFLETHLGLSNDKIQCPICKAGFEESVPHDFSKRFVVHLTSHHGSPETLTKDGVPPSVHKCDKCPAYFLKLVQLDTHKANVHNRNAPGKGRYTCEDCGRNFKHRSLLRLHRTKLHGVEMKLKCSVENCDAKFQTELDLENHKTSIHSGGLHIVLCPTCGKQFKGTGSLKMHLSTHTEKLRVFCCDQCGKTFSDRGILNKHLLSHSGPESWEFTCETCGKKCMTQQKLAEHMRIHSKEKPFVCETCGQAYAHAHNLRIHVNNKHGM